MENTKSQQQSKEKYGTLTATQDANNDYSSSTFSESTSSSKQQASKTKYGTLTAKSDANNDYK
ncbi:MAG: hypothetical protein LLG02_07015 [Pelosinus sp.]|nr:hypothetical protein [Pelosinus sp.]